MVASRTTHGGLYFGDYKLPGQGMIKLSVTDLRYPTATVSLERV